jgi:Ca2+-binding RTX toxin-like protein
MSGHMLGTRSEDNIQPGCGEDQIYAAGATDVATDVATGGTGADAINGMKGRDRLIRSDGDDVHYTGSFNEVRDAVHCGPGWDTVYREEALDTVLDDCEEVIRCGAGGGEGGYWAINRMARRPR